MIYGCRSLICYLASGHSLGLDLDINPRPFCGIHSRGRRLYPRPPWTPLLFLLIWYAIDDTFPLTGDADILPADTLHACFYLCLYLLIDTSEHFQVPRTNILYYRLFKITMASHKKRTSGTSTKRSNMPAGNSTSDGHHGNTKAQIVALSRGQDPAMNAQGSVRKEHTARGQGSSIKDLPQRAGFDAAGIRQWAEDSAAGLEMPEFGCFPQHCSTYADDTSLTTIASAVPATFSFSHPDNLSVSPQMYQPYGSEVDLFPSSTATAEAHFARMDISRDLPSGQGIDCPVSYQGEDLALGLSSQGHLQFDALSTAPDLRFDSMEMHPSMTLGNPNDFDFPSEWNVQLMTGYAGANPMGTSNSVEWSSPTALTPSTSSLQSESLDQQLGTPISATMQEFSWAPAHAGPMATEMEMIPSVGFEETMHARYNNYVDTQRFVRHAIPSTESNINTSTLRPKQGFQRTPLPMDIWAQDTAGQAFGLPPYPGLPVSRRSSEGENKNARDHPYYKAEPSKEDGLYHCPDPNKDGCTKAEKLKCNYE